MPSAGAVVTVTVNKILVFQVCLGSDDLEHWNKVIILTKFSSLSIWQLPVQPLMKISSKWRHLSFSVYELRAGDILRNIQRDLVVSMDAPRVDMCGLRVGIMCDFGRYGPEARFLCLYCWGEIAVGGWPSPSVGKDFHSSCPTHNEVQGW